MNNSMQKNQKLIFWIAAGLVFSLILLIYFLFYPPPEQTNSASSKLAISDISDNHTDYPNNQIPKFEKIEITFQIKNTVAGNFQIPYDSDPPSGIDPSYQKHNGITVDALFLPPWETDWKDAIHQPAFFYQYYDDQTKLSWDGNLREWYYPTGNYAWKVRFSPNQAGTWQYKLTARDKSGFVKSTSHSIDVINSNKAGFIKVSAADSRYFEFDNSKLFNAQGFQAGEAFEYPELANGPLFKIYGQNGINLIRMWISSMYGTAWLEWVGGRNLYDGYLPRAGTDIFHDVSRDQDTLTMALEYGPSGDTGWYDACRFQFLHHQEAVKPHTNYQLQIQYWGEWISGPRISEFPHYGLVGKIGGDWETNCYEPGTSRVVTNYGGSTSDWNLLHGTWNSGENNFLPRIYLGLENVIEGKANIRSISLREELENGQLGPEILNEPSMEYELYIPEQSAYALDKIIQLAEDNGIFLKLVTMEKNDAIYYKLDDDGSFVVNSEKDNPDGFYGIGRGTNKTRWLQKAWWRYLQARWGYSPNIHSWETANEGDPWLEAHYQLTDEMGKFMHCEVFGITIPAVDGKKCSYDHPNNHLVTTSFWHSFPDSQFWNNNNYPNVDYADVHAYISTSQIGIQAIDLEKMQWDAAYFHLGHSFVLGEKEIGKPVVRGEAGIDSTDQQVEQPDLALDKNGVWLHNYLWSTVDSGGLIELYWWSDNRERQSGPDGNSGLYEIYRYFNDFMKNIPLNNGNYQGIEVVLTNPAFRVIGQKDLRNNRAHLWVQNKKHTWKNVVDGVQGISRLPGTVTVSGFSANIILPVEYHAFTSRGLPSITRTNVTTDKKGNLVLSLPEDLLITDVGIKIGSYIP
jgi:hypothetical protein